MTNRISNSAKTHTHSACFYCHCCSGFYSCSYSYSCSCSWHVIPTSIRGGNVSLRRCFLISARRRMFPGTEQATTLAATTGQQGDTTHNRNNIHKGNNKTSYWQTIPRNRWNKWSTASEEEDEKKSKRSLEEIENIEEYLWVIDCREMWV